MLKSVLPVLPILFACCPSVFAQEWKSGIEWQQPPIVTPGETNDLPPSDAIVLFDGTDMSAWEGGEWKVENGIAFSSSGDVRTKQKFGDIQLHIEWSAPTEIKGTGQGRGNSGVYLMEKYEVQILDSFENETYFDGQAGAIYKQTPPWANAMRKPGEWNTYDIIFTAPRFKGNGDVERPAAVTLIHNGVLALNHFELYGPSSYTEAAHYKVHDPTGAIKLQDHGNPVRFRNIWVREIKPPTGKRTSAPYVIRKGEKVDPAADKLRQEQQREQRAMRQAVQSAIKAMQKKEVSEPEKGAGDQPKQ